ncbi:hypothetical protein SDC9_137958 [bioreactor metagenome]|uniref:Uncharacterized protein n=1 Tax=bioreactor metagenome TaxID=1076179 RepID=A0A645DNG3_9ZZZZ
MLIVIPRSLSSGALSIMSNGVKSAPPCLASVLVIAAVSVVLPWSIWPIVPMLRCGLFLTNFSFAISVLPPLDISCLLDSLLYFKKFFSYAFWYFVIMMKSHCVRSPSGCLAPEIRCVTEHLCKRNKSFDYPGVSP